jgi:hypothetical protein
VISLEPELTTLAGKGLLSQEALARRIAEERREVVSLYAELRFLTWAGVMLIVSGVGTLVARNLERIGPVAVTAAIAIASAGCYAYAIWKRRREPSLLDDFILLLGALLLSAATGYAEHQFHLLGGAWPRHLLLLAVIHALTAYAFGSRMVLSVALTSLAAWLGVERTLDPSSTLPWRAFLAAGVIFVWRFADLRIRAKTDLAPVFAHFATNLAFGGALALMRTDLVAACLLALVFAAVSALYGVRAGEEMFVVYAWVYGTIAVDALVIHFTNEWIISAFFMTLSMIGAIAGLIATHARMKRRAA